MVKIVASGSEMAVTVEGQSDGGLVLVSSGVVTGAELITACTNLMAEQNKGLLYVIVDLTAIDEIRASSARTSG